MLFGLVCLTYCIHYGFVYWMLSCVGVGFVGFVFAGFCVFFVWCLLFVMVFACLLGVCCVMWECLVLAGLGVGVTIVYDCAWNNWLVSL